MWAFEKWVQWWWKDHNLVYKWLTILRYVTKLTKWYFRVFCTCTMKIWNWCCMNKWEVGEVIFMLGNGTCTPWNLKVVAVQNINTAALRCKYARPSDGRRNTPSARNSCSLENLKCQMVVRWSILIYPWKDPCTLWKKTNEVETRGFKCSSLRLDCLDCDATLQWALQVRNMS